MRFLLNKFDFLGTIGEFVFFISRIVGILFKHVPNWNLIREQVYSIGVLSLPVVALTGFSTGLVLAAQSFFQLSDKGLAGATGLMVGKVMLTELGPVLTAFMVTGRVGAAMCAELGTMRVTEQIDALETMAVNPLRYLIAPRFLSGLIMLPLLTIFSIFMGVFGGYLIAVFYFGMSPTAYFDPIPVYLNNFDLLIGMVKAFFFGVSIVSIACFKGFYTFGGAEGVGNATTNSVVISYTLILFANFLITLGLNLLKHGMGWFS